MRYLLLHGFTGTPDGVSRFDSRGVTPTLGGHLGTEAVGTFDDEVERLAQLAGDCQGLFGYSLGGRFALGLLARYPRRFAHAIVISAHPGLLSDAERAARREGDQGFVRLLRERGLEAFVDAWQALPLWASQGALSEAVKAEQRRQRLRHEPEGLAQSLMRHGLAEMPNLRPALAEVTTPVELVVGARDSKFVALGQELLGIIPHAHLTVADEAGHNLLLERPQLVSDLLQPEPVP